MILLTQQIEDSLKQCLQKDIQIISKDKILISGKLILYKIIDYTITLTFQIDNESKNIDIPYPFNIEKTVNGFSFIYTLNSLCDNDSNLLSIIQGISKKRDSRFYNSYVNFFIV